MSLNQFSLSPENWRQSEPAQRLAITPRKARYSDMCNTLNIDCPWCSKATQHRFVFEDSGGNTINVVSTCAGCGLTGAAACDSNEFRTATGKSPTQRSLFALLPAMRSAVLQGHTKLGK